MIIARCDVDEWGEKLERLAACMEAGADGAWISAREPDRIRELCRTVGKPTIGVQPQGMTLREYQEAGAGCTVIPGALQIAALCVQKALLEELKQTGAVQDYLGGLPFIEEMRPFYLQQGSEELKRIEQRYGGGALE
jgi:2-methylisocitrate lyase-like PEP mutase family enzyme